MKHLINLNCTGIDFIPNIQLSLDDYWNYDLDIKKYYIRLTFTWIKWYFEIEFRKKDN